MEDVPVVVTSEGEKVEGKLNTKDEDLSHYLDFTQLNFDRYSSNFFPAEVNAEGIHRDAFCKKA